MTLPTTEPSTTFNMYCLSLPMAATAACCFRPSDLTTRSEGNPIMSNIFLEYVCPSMGVILAGVMFSAPIHDLRKALLRGSLGFLNPFPWSIMTGNCLGWVAYGYYTSDPFVVAGNLPGFVMSLWLNLGAAKLQYHSELRNETEKQRQRQRQHQREEASSLQGSDASGGLCFDTDPSAIDYTEQLQQQRLVMVPQEVMLLRILFAWCAVLVWVGWVYPSGSPAHVVGLVVNANLVFFYGAPLERIWIVMRTKCCDSIHLPTMVLNWTNTSFWLMYGFARRDPIIMVPNALGLSLGIAQGILCLIYPRSGREFVTPQELDPDEDGEAVENLVV